MDRHRVDKVLLMPMDSPHVQAMQKGLDHVHKLSNIENSRQDADTNRLKESVQQKKPSFSTAAIRQTTPSSDTPSNNPSDPQDGPK